MEDRFLNDLCMSDSVSSARESLCSTSRRRSYYPVLLTREARLGVDAIGSTHSAAEHLDGQNQNMDLGERRWDGAVMRLPGSEGRSWLVGVLRVRSCDDSNALSKISILAETIGSLKASPRIYGASKSHRTLPVSDRYRGRVQLIRSLVFNQPRDGAENLQRSLRACARAAPQ